MDDEDRHLLYRGTRGADDHGGRGGGYLGAPALIFSHFVLRELVPSSDILGRHSQGDLVRLGAVAAAAAAKHTCRHAICASSGVSTGHRCCYWPCC